MSEQRERYAVAKQQGGNATLQEPRPGEYAIPITPPKITRTLPRFIRVLAEAHCDCHHRFGSVCLTFWRDGFWEMLHSDGKPEEEFTLHEETICPRCGQVWKFREKRTTER